MESIQKTKSLFHKKLDNLKSFLFVGYQKLSKPTIPDPFSCSGCSRKKNRKDRSLADFCESWDVGLEESEMRKNEAIIAMSLKEQLREEEDKCSHESFMNFSDMNTPVKNMKENGGKEEKKKARGSKSSKGEEQYYHKRKGGGENTYALEQKMKELEMMDVGDMEHVLDVEEALHYYSRLKSPVYLSIVDKFFTDMYSEFSHPHPLASASINSSKRRFGSASINSSRRRFGSIRL